MNEKVATKSYLKKYKLFAIHVNLMSQETVCIIVKQTHRKVKKHTQEKQELQKKTCKEVVFQKHFCIYAKQTIRGKHLLGTQI